MKMKSFLIILLVIILLAAYYKRMGHTKTFQFFLVDHERHWRSLKLMKVNNPPPALVQLIKNAGLGSNSAIIEIFMKWILIRKPAQNRTYNSCISPIKSQLSVL